MEGRIVALIPSIISLVVYAIGVLLLARGFITPRIRSILKQQVVDQKTRFHLALWFAPIASVVMPAFEEIVFRSPLILGFAEPVGYTRVGIVISSVLFAFVHLLGLSEKNLRIFAVIMGRSLSRSEIQRKAWRQVTLAFIFGCILGYLAILWQSLWNVYVIHAIWNFCALMAASTYYIYLKPFLQRTQNQ